MITRDKFGRGSLRQIAVVWMLLVGTSILFSRLSWAAPGSEPPANPPSDNVAAVEVDGNTLFLVRGVTSVPPKERAKRIAANIVKIAADPSIPVDAIQAVRTGDHITIEAAGVPIMLVFPEDAAVEGVSHALLGAIFQKEIQTAVGAYRDDRSRAHLVDSGIRALVALLATLLIWFLLSRLLRRLNRVLEMRIERRIDEVESRSFHLVRSAQIWRTIHLLFSAVKTLVMLVVATTFVVYCLGLFPWTRGVARRVLEVVVDPVVVLGQGLVDYLPSFAFLVVIFLVTRYLLRLANLLFVGISQGAIRLGTLDAELAMPLYRILSILILVFAIVIAYPYIPGSESDAFKGISLFLGLLVSLGSSSFIGNIIAGYAMVFRRAFRSGDEIMVDGQVVRVEELKTMVTRVRTKKNETIFIPNSTLINSNIINYSSLQKQAGLILHTSVRIGYGTPWRQVDEMLITAAYRTSGLLKEPKPFVLKKSLEEFAVQYELNAYCGDAATMPQVYNELHGHILDVFNENDVQIMTPAYEGDPEVQKVVPKERWFTPVLDTDPRNGGPNVLGDGARPEAARVPSP